MLRANLKTTLFCVFVLYSFAAYAQNNTIDSLQKVLRTQKEDTSKVNTLNTICWNLFLIEDYNVMQYANEALSLSEKTNFHRGKGAAYINISWAFMAQPNYLEALKNSRSALEFYQRSGDKTGIAESYHLLGQIYSAEGNFPEALKNFYAALKIREEIGDKKGVARSYHLIGGINSGQGNYIEALKNYAASLKIHEELDNKFGIALVYNGIGGIYFFQNNYDEALKSFFASLRIYEELKLSWGIFNCHNNIGTVYEEQGKIALAGGGKAKSTQLFAEALKNYSSSLKLAEETQKKDDLALSFLNLGSIHIKLKKLPEAKKYLEKSLRLYEASGNKTMFAENYKCLSDLDSIEGNYLKAFEHYKMYILYRDSLNNEESIRKSEQIKIQYEFDKKEDQIKLLSTENKLKTALAGREGQRKKMAYAGIGIILLSGGFGFYRYRRRKRLQSQQTILNERLRISRELHDEVGATLSGISMYSHLAKEQIKTAQKEEVERSLNIMQQSSGEMVNKLNDIVWLINPEQDTLQKLVERLEEYATDMAAIKNMKVKITVPDKIAELSLPVESRRNIYLFCKEAINNAVKYSQGSLLELSIKETDNKLEVSVSDNGKGFDAVMVKRGNGLENMQKRADEIGARLLLQSKLDGGTLVSMQLKIT